MRGLDDNSNGDYEIGLSNEKTFIIIRIKKYAERKLDKIFRDDFARLVGRNGIRRFLIDVRDISSEINSLQAYILAQDLLQTHLFSQGLESILNERLQKQAIVVGQVDDTYGFIATVTRNRGRNARIFVDYDDAVAWIEERTSV